VVTVGDRVRRGQVIGHVGKTSARYTFTAHLHYEERRDHHAVRAFFNGRLAEPYLHMEAVRRMKSRNCGTTPAPAPAPAPAPPAPQPQPQPDTPDRAVGVPLPNIARRFAATIRTDNGMLVKARRGPRTTAAEVRSLKGGTGVQIVCQTRGEQVTGKFGTSRIWDLIDLGGGRGAYVTDTYVYTGSDGRVAPDCP
jgi:pyruvate/2-oxoglutarate dehydrogenase complex dihydrolipoamide acyltransferase (E2) component